MKAREIWKKKSKKNQIVTTGKRNILIKPIDQMTQTSETIKFCAGSIRGRQGEARQELSERKSL
jgi:hypothetical protein